jgi:hypothetical protein
MLKGPRHGEIEKPGYPENRTAIIHGYQNALNTWRVPLPEDAPDNKVATYNGDWYLGSLGIPERAFGATAQEAVQGRQRDAALADFPRQSAAELRAGQSPQAE